MAMSLARKIRCSPEKEAYAPHIACKLAVIGTDDPAAANLQAEAS